MKRHYFVTLNPPIPQEMSTKQVSPSRSAALLDRLQDLGLAGRTRYILIRDYVADKQKVWA